MPRKLTNIERPVPDDITIAQACVPLPISTVAEELGLAREDYDEHGRSKAKARAPHLRASAALLSWRHTRLTAAHHRTALASQVKLSVLEKLSNRPSGYYGAFARPAQAEP
jgi:hypothetical protein